MVPGLFNMPPPSRRRSYLKPDRGDPAACPDPDAPLFAFAVTLAGIVGFLGLLIAGSLLPKHAMPLRGLALVWFAVFGVWHVRVSGRTRRSGRWRPSSDG
jgi:hypothetical protein